MTPEKKAARKKRNLERKAARAEAHKNLMVQLGRSLVKTETPKVDEEGVALKDADGKPLMETTYDFPPYIKLTADGSVKPIKYDFRQKVTKLAWLNGKQSAGSRRKSRPGEPQLHAEAIVEDASRSFTREVDKALAPVVPVVPIDAAPEAAKL